MTGEFTVHHLDHIVFHIRDLERSLAFYKMFDNHIEARPDGNTRVCLGPTTRLLLHVDPDYRREGEGNLDHLSLLLETAGDVNDVAEYVKSHGGTPFDGPRDTGRDFRQFRVLDPDGNELELRVKEHAKPS